MNLTETEAKVISRLLEMAYDYFSNRGCNDFDLSFLPVEERRKIVKQYEEYNGTPEDFDPEDEYEIFTHFCLFGMFAHKLEPERKRMQSLPNRMQSQSEMDDIVNRLTLWNSGISGLTIDELHELIKKLNERWAKIRTNK